MKSSSRSEPPRPLILVVEDDEAVCRMIARMLEPVGEVRTAYDGVEALRLVRANLSPDLIVTDLMMPVMDGVSLVKRLKGDPSTRNIPVVMLTAKDQPTDVIEGINAGARHYLTKPFKREELLEKVKRALHVR